MDSKCSPSDNFHRLVPAILCGSLLLAACGGARTTVDEALPSAGQSDTVSTASGDSIAPRPAVPTTLPRLGRDRTRAEDAVASGRPAYAQLQVLPAVSDEFAGQFGVADAQLWSSGVQRGLVVLHGCSGALVSAQGLLVTSSSCLDSTIAAAGNTVDVPSDAPFFALPGSELPLTGLEALVLSHVEEVTGVADSLRAADSTLTGADLLKEVAARFAMSSDAGETTVSSNASGSVYAYSYERVNDLRLVFKPERAIAQFGGSFDGGSYPQFKLDVAFLRLFVDGQPYETSGHFAWTERRPRSGAPAFAAGLAAGHLLGVETHDDARPFPTVSGGRIRGFRYGATEAPPVSAFFGLYDHYHSFGPGTAWDVPPAWLRARERVEMEAPVSLVASTEVAGGMLGGALLGLNLGYQATLYDTNREAARDDPGSRRVVALPASATAHALDVVYDAQALLAELRNGRIVD